MIRAGTVTLSLSTAVAFRLSQDTARTRVTLRAGDFLGFALHSRTPGNGDPVFWSQAEIARRLEDTMECWASWSGLHQNYHGPWQELVAASGRSCRR